MGVSSAAELLNLMGVLTGAALCAMLLALVLRGRAGGDRDDALPLLTAVLGLVWNLGELADDLLSRAGVIAPEAWLNVISFAALAILAAVVVHSVARGLKYGRAITVIASACALGAVAVHLRAVVAGELRPSPAAFALLTAAFGAISVPLAIATRRQTNGRRALWMLALALFAVSANHLGHFHDETGGWLAELHRPQRRPAAVLRHPLPGVPLRPRRPVPQAGADAAGGGRRRHRRVRRGRRRCRPGRWPSRCCSARGC